MCLFMRFVYCYSYNFFFTQDVTHFEVFHALLTHSLSGAHEERTQRVLELAPNALNALNLLRLVRISLPASAAAHAQSGIKIFTFIYIHGQK